MKKRRFGIDFFLTKTCNKECYYCTSHTTEKRNLVVDLEFLKFVLDELSKYGPENFTIRLLGGETALIQNLNEVIEILRKYNLQQIEVYSNSLVRVKYSWILNDPSIRYVEHLFYKITDGVIEKLDAYDFLPKNDMNNQNVVILTNDFIKNYHLIDLTPLMHKNTIWKMVNDRSVVDIIGAYEDKYNLFRELIHSNNLELDSDKWSKDKLTKENRFLCSISPPSPVINFENKTIHHCSKTPGFTNSVPCTKDNISKLVKSSLFTDFPDYCKTCKEPALHNRISKLISCKEGIPIN